MERKFILATGLCISVIAIGILFATGTFFAGLLAPVETVKGVVIKVDRGSDEAGSYTWAFVRDGQSVVWILRISGHVPFQIGETYTFQVKMRPSGYYSGPPVTE